ncbi:MAG TPA: MaoC family dehydratase N-terminal domain-containing protein [Ramlibacter sp.]|nr:MaoC family dehydratase N-terminal domain-containing protein [Ramlibacter sp.]
MSGIDIDHLRQWIGRRETLNDLVSAAPLAALAATLDREEACAVVPPLAHWLSFLPIVPMAAVGPDGHPARGGFLPPVPLPRRMWAGSRLGFHQPVQVGDSVQRISEITDVQLKQGQGGALVFVKVRHTVTGPAGGDAITEEQDIVYRDDPRPGEAPAPPRPAPEQAAWRRTIHPDPVLLFRFSALTFNGHRIHYDRAYATGVEGYPGLVVHGPLIATLLVDLVRRERPDARLTAFRFRAVRPLFDTASFEVCGQPTQDGRSVSLWARDTGGALCMEATADLA